MSYYAYTNEIKKKNKNKNRDYYNIIKLRPRLSSNKKQNCLRQ